MSYDCEESWGSMFNADNIHVKLINPADDSEVDILCPPDVLVEDVFLQLINAKFLSDGQYTGTLNGKTLSYNKTMKNNDVVNGDVIALNRTSARLVVNKKRPPAKKIDIISKIVKGIPQYDFDEIKTQPHVMAILLQVLEGQRKELEVKVINLESEVEDLSVFKQKSGDRRTAAIVNAIGGVVMASARILTTDIIPAAVIMVVAIVLITYGLYLTFKKAG